VTLSTNSGATINFSNGGLDIDTTGGTGFSATGGATAVNVTGSGNTITSTSAAALNVVSTTIGASGLNFQSISAGNNSAAADPTNGIVLNNTGTNGGLTVAGNGGTCTSIASCTGGTIQNTTSHGITLTSTQNVSIDHMNIQSTGGSGVRGTTAVHNFAFTNGRIASSGTGGGNQDSSIAFNDPTGSATDAKVTGTVTITGNSLTNALWHGVSILQFDGTLDDVNISNNVITSGTTTGTGGNSLGSGIQLFQGGVATTVASVTQAELNGNTITNFPGGVLIAVQCGTSNGSGPVGSCGTVGSATHDIEIKNNILNGGGTTPNGSGGFVIPNQIMLVTVNGRGQGQFTIQDNGTVADPLSGSAGNIIDISAGGNVTLQATVTGNRIDANGQTVGGTSGIAAGVGPFTVTGPTVLSSATLYATVQSNVITNSAGSGIRLNVNAGDPTLNAIVTGNTVGAPISATYGIQVVEGSNAGFTGNTNLQISSNTSTGGTGGGNTFPGIGLRKFGTASNEFNIVGLSPSPATNAQMEANVAGQNPASASGTFGTGGVAAVNGSSNNWTVIGSVPQPPAVP
jgi:large repetitive protein